MDREGSLKGLAAFDLDGTLLRGRTVCQMLAVPCGRVAEVENFEAMRDEAAISAGRAAMAEWYRAVPPDVLMQALDSSELAPTAAAAVSRLTACGIEVVIASMTWSFAVERFAQRLGVRTFLGTELLPDGAVRHVWPRDKGRWLLAQADRVGVAHDRVAAIGDSAGDRELLLAASLRVCVGVTVPPGVGDVWHVPNGDLVAVAERIIDTWHVR